MLNTTVKPFTRKDLEAKPKEELESLLKQQKHLSSFFKNVQMAIKIFMNSVYGACANKWFAGYKVHIAAATTAEGREATKFSLKIVNHYFHNLWHKDVKLHKKMGLKNVKPISKSKELAFYCDTDSVERDSLIQVNGVESTIEHIWKEFAKDHDIDTSQHGHEIIDIAGTGHKIKNWSEDRGLYDAPLHKIVRHKVSKPKWKLKTKSGKEVIVTNDHSMIVLRNGKKIEVKPSEMNKETDKIVTIKKST